MKCPECRSRSDVIETRERSKFVTRRHRCGSCFIKFTTREYLFDTKRKPIGQSKEQMQKVRELSSRGKYEP